MSVSREWTVADFIVVNQCNNFFCFVFVLKGKVGGEGGDSIRVVSTQGGIP